MLSDALRYPVDGDGWLRTIVIGGLLTVLSVLVVPLIFLQGYYVRVLRGVTNDDPLPPAFDGWTGLFVDGLKFFVVNLAVVVAMVLVQAFVAIVLGTGSFLADATGASDPSVGGPAGLAGLALLVGAVAVIGYVSPAMFANFAREDSLVAAFDLPTILAGTLSVEYFVAWLLALLVGTVLGVVAGLLSLLLVGIFGLFYVQIVTYYLFGRGFAAGLAGDGGGSADGVTY